MSSLPFSGYSLDPGGNIYDEVTFQRLQFRGSAKVTIEGETVDGNPVKIVFHNLHTQGRSGIGVAEIQCDHMNLVINEDRIVRQAPAKRLVIDAEAGVLDLTGETHRIYVNPPRLRGKKYDADGKVVEVIDVTHHCKVRRVGAVKVHPCSSVGCPHPDKAIVPGEAYLQITDYEKHIWVGNRRKYDVAKYHDRCQPQFLSATVDVVMGRA